MRSGLGLLASALAGLAGVIASMDGDASIVPFFIGLTFAGGVEAWAVHPPPMGWRQLVAGVVAVLWLIAGIWIGGLLLMVATHVMEASGPPPAPEATYLGLTATVYHVLGLYGGLLAVMASAWGPGRWFRAGERLTGPAANR